MENGVVSRFMRYASCPSQSHNERDFCELMERELEKMEIPYERQYLGNQVLTDGWNILAKVPGRIGEKPFLMVFHLDTAAPGLQGSPAIENGRIVSKCQSVLGADGKLSIALVMEAIDNLKKSGKLGRPVELLFTVCQELGLLGSKYGDYSSVDSEEALVMDHYVTGEVLTETPARIRLNVELIGSLSHVIRDEEWGSNALTTAVEVIHQIPVGRIREELTINIFDLVSLSPSNEVPRHARFNVEIRCFGDSALDRAVTQIREIVKKTAEAAGCQWNITKEQEIPEMKFDENKELFQRLERIYQDTGISMRRAKSFGIMDATYIQKLGIKTVPLGINIYQSHSTKEYVVLDDIKKMYDLTEAILQKF